MRNISSRKLNAGLVALAAFSSVLVTGCSSEGIVDAPEDKVPIVLRATIEGTSSRSVSPTVHDEAFDAGEIIGVMDPSGATSINWNYTVNADGTLTGTSPAYISSADAGTMLFAWYPSDAFTGVTNEAISFTVQDNQSSDENYKKSDLLIARANVSHQKPSVTLTFGHKLTKIRVNLTRCMIGGVDKAATATIELKGVFKTAVAANSDYPWGAILAGMGELTAKTASATGNVTMKDSENSSTSVAAIIPPQTIRTVNEVFFTVTTEDGIVLSAPLTEDCTFEAGKEYIFNLSTDDQANLKATSAKIGGWGVGNSTTGTDIAL